MELVILVGCGRRKCEHTARAREMYTSPLFRARRAYAEASGGRWFILSAKHGLLRPGTVIEPYNVALAELPNDLQRAWAAQVQAQLRCVAPEARFLVLADPVYNVGVVGLPYENPLMDADEATQLHWLANQRRNHNA